jgi:hypothetical protein
VSQYRHILNALEAELAEAHKELAETQEVSQAVCDLRDDLSDARDVIDILRGEMAEARDACRAIWPFIEFHVGCVGHIKGFQEALDKVKAQVSK